MIRRHEASELPEEIYNVLSLVFPRGWLLVFTHPEGHSPEGTPRERIVYQGMTREGCGFLEWYQRNKWSEQWCIGSVMEAGGEEVEAVTYEKKSPGKKQQPFMMPLQLVDELKEVLPRGWVLFYTYPVKVEEDGSMLEKITATVYFREKSVMHVWAQRVLVPKGYALYIGTE